jgi:hypothetical protein
VQRIYEYRSKQYNNWIIIVYYYVGDPCFTVVVFYVDEFGLNGVRVDADNKSLTKFTPHFLERYNERFLKLGILSKLELLKRFVSNNTLEAVKYVSDSETNQVRIFGKFKEGIGLGYKETFSDIRKEIIHYKTFISNEMILGSQVDDFNSTCKLYDSYWNEMPKIIKRCA